MPPKNFGAFTGATPPKRANSAPYKCNPNLRSLLLPHVALSGKGPRRPPPSGTRQRRRPKTVPPSLEDEAAAPPARSAGTRPPSAGTRPPPLPTPPLGRPNSEFAHAVRKFAHAISGMRARRHTQMLAFPLTCLSLRLSNL